MSAREIMRVQVCRDGWTERKQRAFATNVSEFVLSKSKSRVSQSNPVQFQNQLDTASRLSLMHSCSEPIS